jgi:hypothetical protein
MAKRLKKVKKLEERIAPSAIVAGGRPYPAGAPFPGYASIDASGNVVFTHSAEGSVGGNEVNTGISGSGNVDASAGNDGIDVGGNGHVRGSGGWNG